MPNPTRVLVVDDSALMRKLLSELLRHDPAMEVVGQARDGADALRQIETLRPDVLTLDVEMPVLDGYGTLTEIMRRFPTPVVMVSSLTQAGADATIRCLEMGAVDFVGKPSGAISLDLHVVAAELIAKVKTAARAALTPFPCPKLGTGVPVAGPSAASRQVAPELVAGTPLPNLGQGKGVRAGARSRTLLVIGSSTGGPRALQTLLPALPADLNVPIVVVQHMPAGFTQSLARRLDAAAPFSVREAAPGDVLRPGVALLAPGGHHLVFDAGGAACLSDEPPVHGVRPSVDATLSSLIRTWGASRLIAVLLTGMGQDGARGLKAVRDGGGATLAEDESTCVVYGMPKAARDLNGVGQMLPLDRLAPAISQIVRGTTAAAPAAAAA